MHTVASRRVESKKSDRFSRFDQHIVENPVERILGDLSGAIHYHEHLLVWKHFALRPRKGLRGGPVAVQVRHQNCGSHTTHNLPLYTTKRPLHPRLRTLRPVSCVHIHHTGPRFGLFITGTHVFTSINCSYKSGDLVRDAARISLRIYTHKASKLSHLYVQMSSKVPYRRRLQQGYFACVSLPE